MTVVTPEMLIASMHEAIAWVEEKQARWGEEGFSPEWYERMKDLLKGGGA